MSVILEETFDLVGGTPMPSVTALRGANSLEALGSGEFAVNDLILVVIDTLMSGWQLNTGTADPNDTQNQVQALDNVGLYWKRVGGFGATYLAGARLTNAAAISLSHNVATALTFDTARFNSGGWISTNASKFTVAIPGIYALTGAVQFAASAVGQRSLSLRVNGATVVGSNTVPATSIPVTASVSTLYQLASGDYVELVAQQNSGGNLNITKVNAYSPEFSVLWVGSSTVIGTPVATTPPGSTTTPPGATPDIVLPFTITDTGWYRVWSGVYPASGNFNIKRPDNGDAQTSDTVVDFTITAQSPEGIVNISRNSVPNTGSPSIDSVRIYHDAGLGLSYVEAHLLRSGQWQLSHTADDINYLDSPYLVADVFTSDGSLTYKLKPNVTGGTGKIDVPQIDSGAVKLLGPPVNTWAAATGTPARTTFDTSTATLTQVAQRLKALVDDAIAAGWLRAGIPSSMLYSDMLALTDQYAVENAVANDTDIFRVSVAPDTTVQGIYTPVGTFNGHTNYKIQGYEWDTSNAYACRWSTEWSKWTILNASGNLYHDAATNTNPWNVAQWKDQASANVAVTTVAPNIPMTYNALTDTHTAMIVSSSANGWNGLYLRGADLNGKRRYYIVGTGSNNKRLEWSGSQWLAKDDSTTDSSTSEAVTYPDQAIAWGTAGGGEAISVTGISAVDLMSGLTVGDPTSTYNGIYVPVQGVYNVAVGRKLVYRRLDGSYFIYSNSPSNWILDNDLVGSILVADTDGNFPWNAAWTTAGVTVQQNKIASPGWVNGVSQGNITGNVTGNFHL